MLSRKTLGLVASCAVASLFIGGCGPSTSSKNASESKPQSGATSAPASSEDKYKGIEPAKEISFWTNHPGGSVETEKALIDAFTKETGIKVNHVNAGGNYEEVFQKFQTAQATNNVGDVVVLSDATWFPAFLNDTLTPIDDALKTVNADTSTYVKALYDDYLYEGKHYAVPYARSTPLFYYNKADYKAAGLPDQAPKTWDEVKDNAQKIMKAKSGSKGFGFPPGASYPAWSMVNLVWGNGGAWSNEWDFSALTSDPTVKALSFAKQGIKDGWAIVTSSDPDTAFSSGAISQTIASTGSLSGILKAATFDVGAGFLPEGPNAGGKGVVPTGGAGMAMSSKSSPDKQLAAAKFISFMTNTASTQKFSAATGYLPVRTDADMAAVYSKSPQFKVAVEQLAKTRSQDYARVFVPGGDKAISDGVVKILTTDEPKSVLEGVQKTIEKSYKDNVAPKLKK